MVFCKASNHQLVEILQHELEKLDPRGRTPLHLAISLGHMECAKVLLRNKAAANKENAGFWTG